MYPYNYVTTSSSKTMPMYRNTSNIPSSYSTSYPYSSSYSNSSDDRFFLAPFVVGGLAGTALGYGIANNNQINNRPCCGFMPYPMMQPMPYNNYPTFTNTNYNY